MKGKSKTKEKGVIVIKRGGDWEVNERWCLEQGMGGGHKNFEDERTQTRRQYRCAYEKRMTARLSNGVEGWYYQWQGEAFMRGWGGSDDSITISNRICLIFAKTRLKLTKMSKKKEMHEFVCITYHLSLGVCYHFRPILLKLGNY